MVIIYIRGRYCQISYKNINYQYEISHILYKESLWITYIYPAYILFLYILIKEVKMLEIFCAYLDITNFKHLTIYKAVKYISKYLANFKLVFLGERFSLLPNPLKLSKLNWIFFRCLVARESNCRSRRLSLPCLLVFHLLIFLLMSLDRDVYETGLRFRSQRFGYACEGLGCEFPASDFQYI